LDNWMLLWQRVLNMEGWTQLITVRQNHVKLTWAFIWIYYTKKKLLIACIRLINALSLCWCKLFNMLCTRWCGFHITRLHLKNIVESSNKWFIVGSYEIRCNVYELLKMTCYELELIS
jgi:hypothetical protein